MLQERGYICEGFVSQLGCGCTRAPSESPAGPFPRGFPSELALAGTQRGEVTGPTCPQHLLGQRAAMPVTPGTTASQEFPAGHPPPADTPLPPAASRVLGRERLEGGGGVAASGTTPADPPRRRLLNRLLRAPCSPTSGARLPAARAAPNHEGISSGLAGALGARAGGINPPGAALLSAGVCSPPSTPVRSQLSCCVIQ